MVPAYGVSRTVTFANASGDVRGMQHATSPSAKRLAEKQRSLLSRGPTRALGSSPWFPNSSRASAEPCHTALLNNLLTSYFHG